MSVDFLEAWELVQNYEGGLCNDLDDRGGLTYKGIASKKEIDWVGWPLIIGIAASMGINNLPDIPDTDKVTYSRMETALRDSIKVQDAVFAFYKGEWDSLHCGELACQELATSLFDTAVNMGRGRAVEFLQTALNVLNRNQESWDDLVVDGGLGEKTLGILALGVVKEDCVMVAKVMNILKGAFYVDIMKRVPSQEKFARGWLSRVWVI